MRNVELGGGTDRFRARGSEFMKRLTEKDCIEESISVESALDNSSYNLTRVNGAG
jgi:hypothetical protein